MRTKLVIVEGLPGSGKTTTASAIHEVLTNNYISSELFLEGNLDHLQRGCLLLPVRMGTAFKHFP